MGDDLEIDQLLWDSNNESHIARHSVTPLEVEQVVFDPGTYWERDDSHRAGRLVAWGITAAGRHLIVVIEAVSPNRTSYPVTARPMSPRERRSYEGRSRGSQA